MVLFVYSDVMIDDDVVDIDSYVFDDNVINACDVVSYYFSKPPI